MGRYLQGTSGDGPVEKGRHLTEECRAQHGKERKSRKRIRHGR